MVRISSVQLRNFRCFSELSLNFEGSPLVLITGANGSGKTSLLEALYYACFLRSFKASSPQELILDSVANRGFSLSLSISANLIDDLINIIVAPPERTVRLNQKAIRSHRDILNAYRVTSITQDDNELIQGAPQHRRYFLDQLITVAQPSYAKLLASYRRILENRNALLHQQHGRDKENYLTWTQQLLDQSILIRAERELWLEKLVEKITLFAATLKNGGSIKITYSPHEAPMTGKDAYEAYADREYGLHRSCVGAHLDDFSILFDGRAARYYASKGQQKLMLFLFKLSQASLIKEQAQQGVVLLIDDFLSDFDNQRLDETLELARSVGTQLLITSPQSGSGGLLKERLMGYNAHIITL